MRNFKAFITLNVPQKCSVKYYTNAEKLKISKKIVQSVEYSPRPEKGASYKLLKLFLGYFKPFFFSQTFSKFLYYQLSACNFFLYCKSFCFLISFDFFKFEICLSYKSHNDLYWVSVKSSSLISPLRYCFCNFNNLVSSFSIFFIVSRNFCFCESFSILLFENDSETELKLLFF